MISYSAMFQMETRAIMIGPDIGRHPISGHQKYPDLGYYVTDIGKIPISGVLISGKY